MAERVTVLGIDYGAQPGMVIGACPERFRGGIERYISHRIAPGAFLRAVLENDLMGAVGHADEESARELKALVSWLWQEMPSNLWGTKERVAAWLNPGKAER